LGAGCRSGRLSRSGPFFPEEGWILDERGSPPSILLVEDDDFGREALARILEVDGYRVQVAANGDEARRHLHGTTPPALIVLDLFLPRPDGWRLVQEQRHDPALAGIPVIVVSSAEAPLERLCSEGVVARFEKPLAVGELLATIHKHLAP
jgi:putative two-component system response regulator